MDKELNEDARTKQDLLYECSSLESKLSNEIIKNEHLEQQCKKQKEVINKANEWVRNWMHGTNDWFEEDTKPSELLDILKEVE